MNFEGIQPEPEFDEEFIVEYSRREIEQAFSNARAGIFPNARDLAALAAQYKENAKRRRQAEIGDFSEPRTHMHIRHDRRWKIYIARRPIARNSLIVSGTRAQLSELGS